MAIRNGRGIWNITGKPRRLGKRILLAATLAAVSCGGDPGSSDAPRVDPADHDAFYLWSGVEPVAGMEDAEAVYLHWGELRRGDPNRMVVLRRTVPRAMPGELWLVVRAERLDWGDGAYTELARSAQLWNRDGALTGVQVDFDASTPRLGDYARFLKDLRNRLDPALRLSATGLMDWPANASATDLAAVAQALDEIVIQTYRGTRTVQGYGAYLAATSRLALPYRIAVVEGGVWSLPSHIAADPRYQGTVVFLLSDGAKARQDRGSDAGME